MTTYEVERKYRLSDADVAVPNAVSEATAQRQLDRVFLMGRDSFVGFRRGDPVVRVRVVDDKLPEVTLKRALDGDANLEVAFEVPSLDAATEFLVNLGMQEVVTVDKTRSTGVVDGVTISVDDVKGIGRFLEIEILTDATGIEQAEARVDALAQKLGLNPDQIETRKYDQLITEARQAGQ